MSDETTDVTGGNAARKETTLDRIDFSVVVPTRDRPNDLLDCIESIGEQTHLPLDVVIVNDGTLTDDIVSRLDRLSTDDVDLAMTSSVSEPVSGTGAARNVGMRAARGSVVLFLDDDTVLEPTYLERLYRLYDLYDTPELAGIGGLLHGPRATSSSRPLEYVFDALFYQGTEPWRLNAAGFSNQSYRAGTTLQCPRRADWLPGSNMSFKRDVVTDYRFPQWDPGREPGEDLVLGWQLKRDGYYCLIDPHLPLEHKGGSRERDAIDATTWTRLGRNRVRAFRMLGEDEHLPLFLWAMIGAGLREAVVPVFNGRWETHLKRGTGFLEGAIREAFAPFQEDDSEGLRRRRDADGSRRGSMHD